MSDLRVALTTSLNDRLVAPLRRTLDEVEKNFKEVEKKLGQVTDATQITAVALNKVGEVANTASQKMVGMQGPTQAAKQVVELAKSTQNAVVLADKLTHAWSLAGNTIKGVTAGVAAFQAAKFVVAAPLEQARSYEKQLADAANIAYAGQSQNARRSGMLSMNASVEASVRAGGGTRESALKGMNDLYAANISKDDVEYLLPHVQKYATAGNADPSNIANLVIYGLRSLKLKREDIPLMLDKTLASTNVGSMELDNLAKWMPQIGAAGGAAGLAGMKGYERMLAGVQTSRLTAGTKDEAGTNFKDLLSMINGHALMTAAKSIGIDAAGSIAKHIGGGGDALSGVLALSDYVVDKDPRFAVLQKRLNASQIKKDAKGQPLYSPEQEDIMRQQATLFAGSSLGKLFHNQQSMQALVALRNNRDYFKENIDATGKANGQVGEGNMDLLRSTNEFKVQQKANEELFALTQGLGGVNSVIGRLAEGTTDLYRRYPEYAQAIESAKLALTALAAAAGAAGLASLAMGGAGGVGGKLLGALGGAGGMALGAAGLGAAGAVGYGAGTLLYKGALEGNAGGDFVGEKVARLMAFLGNDEAKAAVDQNDKMDAMTAQAQALTAVAQRPIKIVLDGREIAAAVNGYNDFVTRRK